MSREKQHVAPAAALAITPTELRPAGGVATPGAGSSNAVTAFEDLTVTISAAIAGDLVVEVGEDSSLGQ